MNRKILIGIVSVAALVAILLWVFDSPAGSGSGKPMILSANWDPEYQLESSDPRGLGFFNELVDAHVDDSVHTAARSTQLDSITDAETATYLFIGKDFAITDEELDTVLQYVDSGATLMLCFDESSQNVYSTFFDENAYYWEYTNRTYVAIEDTSLVYASVFQSDTIYDDWYTFDPEAILDTNYKAFAFSMYKPVAVELKRGKGKIILHSMPRLFVNYQVLAPNGFTHASYILRKIPQDKPVIWLEFGRFDQNAAIQDTGTDEDKQGEKEDTSYLQYIMQDPALRWAFMLAILVFLLYAFFRAKRREAVLQGVPEKRNMSLSYVETLSSIYLSRNSPYGILLVLRKNFYMAVNRHFYVDLMHKEDNKDKREETIKRLVEKSSVEAEELRDLLNILDTRPGDSHKINEAILGQVYRAIRKFYLQTGISRKSNQFVIGDQEVVLHRSLLTGGILTILGMVVLLRGLYLLAAASGYGILLVAGSFLLLYLGIRFLSTPVAKISATSFTLYRPFGGKKSVDLRQGVTYNHTKSGTILYFEDGSQLTIQHALLSRSGKHALRLFTEHIKHQSA